ncbi:hypothetical protein [Mesorhizobium sp. WSM2239]|uniref:Uncharacterized protein n=2 Tax=unclassified Mesorhizobium TaxID=325217 RepID=A0AAU8D0Z0_9HYPH
MPHPKDKSDEELLWESVGEADTLRKRLVRVEQERDAYKKASEGAGVCMTCVIQAPDPYGCSDCLNTGWFQGDPYERVKQLEAVVKKTLRWAEARCPCHNEEPNPCPLCGASVENLEGCKSAENTIPRDLLTELRRV